MQKRQVANFARGNLLITTVVLKSSPSFSAGTSLGTSEAVFILMTFSIEQLLAQINS